jgi:hypothetical protein
MRIATKSYAYTEKKTTDDLKLVAASFKLVPTFEAVEEQTISESRDESTSLNGDNSWVKDLHSRSHDSVADESKDTEGDCLSTAESYLSQATYADVGIDRSFTNYHTDNDSENNATASCTDADESISLNGDNSWVEIWDRLHGSVTEESTSPGIESVQSREDQCALGKDMSELFAYVFGIKCGEVCEDMSDFLTTWARMKETCATLEGWIQNIIPFSILENWIQDIIAFPMSVIQDLCSLASSEIRAGWYQFHN